MQSRYHNSPVTEKNKETLEQKETKARHRARVAGQVSVMGYSGAGERECVCVCSRARRRGRVGARMGWGCEGCRDDPRRRVPAGRTRAGRR